MDDSDRLRQVSSHSGAGSSSSERVGSNARLKSSKMSSSRYKRASLSVISEGDELTKLQDVLNKRGSWLTQEELWAVCRECCLTLKRISSSSESLQSLKVMLETVAFDLSGNVSFIKNSTDSDNHYRPPEFDKIGNSTKGFIYSLGFVMYEASAYNSEAPELPQHSPRLRKLLKNMMEPDYSERMNLESVIQECDQLFRSAGGLSSLEICKDLVQQSYESLNNGYLSESSNSASSDRSRIQDDLDTTKPSASSSISNLQITSADMSLQELVEKYKPSRLQDKVDHFNKLYYNIMHPSRSKYNGNDIEMSFDNTQGEENPGANCERSLPDVLLFPPEQFETKLSQNDDDANSTSAFTNKAVSSTLANSHFKKSDVGEGATLKAGNAPLKLPEAYKSSATHFSPIILASHEKKTSPTRGAHARITSKTDRTIKELKKQMIKSLKAKEGEAKMSPQDSQLSPKITSNSPTSPSDNPHSPNVASIDNLQSSTQTNRPMPIKPVSAPTKPVPAPTKPVPAPKPASAQAREKFGESTPVTHAVKPTPRRSENILANNTNSDGGTITDRSTTLANQNAQPAAQLPSVSPPSLSVVSSNQTAQPLVVSNPAIPHSPAIIPSYPVVLQRDPSSGTVSWIPVVPNASPYNLAPYWAMTPQPPPVIPSLPHQTISSMQSGTPESHKTAAGDANHLTNRADVLSPEDTPTPERESARARLRNSGLAPSNVVPTKTSSASPNAQTRPAPVKRTNVPKKNSESVDTSAKKPSDSKPNNPDYSVKSGAKQSSTLSGIRQLLRNEFAFDGYMEQGQEDVEMATFISSLLLPALEYTQWCNVVVAKYGDLYWSDELLASLYKVVHGKAPDTDRPPSGTLRTKSARVISVDEPSTAKKEIKQLKSSKLDKQAISPFRPIPAAVDTQNKRAKVKSSNQSQLIKPKPVIPQIQQTESSVMDVVFTQAPIPLGMTKMKSISVQDISSQTFQTSPVMLTKSKSQSNILALTRPVKTATMTPLVKSLILPNGGTRKVMFIEGKEANPMYDDFWTNRSGSANSAFEQESDSHSHSSASELRVKGRLQSSSYTFTSNSFDEHQSDGLFEPKVSSEYGSESGLSGYMQQCNSRTRICHVIVYATHMLQDKTTPLLSDKTVNDSVDGLSKKIADLNQQIAVYYKRRNKAIKYIKKIADTSAKGGGGDYKVMVSQIKTEYQESVKELDRLMNAKSQLEVLAAEQSSIDISCLFSITKVANPLIVVETNNNPSLQFQTQKSPDTNAEEEVLYAGQPIGLISYLYSRGAVKEGYILDFFHTFRYFVDSSHLLAFITEKYNSAKLMKPCEIRDKVMRRSLDLLIFWLNSYYTIDFIELKTLISMLINFLQDELLSEHQAESDLLLRLLDEYENDKSKNSKFYDPLPRNDELPGSDESIYPLTKKWSSCGGILTIGGGKTVVQYRRTHQGITYMSYKSIASNAEANNTEGFALTDYNPSDLAEQLTLMEQRLFDDVHPVNFMNSLAQGIGASLAESGNESIPLKEKRLMFQCAYMQLVALGPMVQHSKRIAHWATAEVINAGSTKMQIAVILKLIQIAKICKDIRNFATCISIKDGLDHILIRDRSAWKDIPAKLVQELEDVKILHKTDPYALKQDESQPALPTIPCALLFALHVQQHEKGGFTLANGMYRWPKLRSLARLVDIIRICKCLTYQFKEDEVLSRALQNRMSEMSSHSLETLAITANTENSRSSSGNSGTNRWVNAFKRVKNKLHTTA